MKIFIYGKEQRQFHGNQYIGKTWRTFKTILSGTWTGLKEMAGNPGKVLLALLVLGQSFAAFTISAQPHLLSIQSAWADLTTSEEVKYVREVVEVKEEPAVIMERIAKCESNGKHYLANGRINSTSTWTRKRENPQERVRPQYRPLHSSQLHLPRGAN